MARKPLAAGTRLIDIFMSNAQLSSQISSKIQEIEELYHRLLLLVGPPGCGKTMVLQELQREKQSSLLNVNLDLSRQMLEIPEAKRSYHLPRILKDILPRKNGLILLDNTEILFDISLKQDPLRLLQGLSRNRSIVATWNGRIEDEFLTYAEAEHPEYRRYSAKDLTYLNLTSS